MKKLITLVAVFALMATGCQQDKGQKQAPTKPAAEAAPAEKSEYTAAMAEAAAKKSAGRLAGQLELFNQLKVDALTAGIKHSIEATEVLGYPAKQYWFEENGKRDSAGVMVEDDGEIFASIGA